MIDGLKPYLNYRESGSPWLGRYPAHWELPRLGAVLRERGETNEARQMDQVLSVMKDIGVIPYEEKGRVGNKKSEDTARYKIVRPDDIVVNCMNVIIGSVGLSRYTGCLSPVYYVLTRRSHADNPSYLNGVFQTKPFQLSLVRIGNGILAHRMRIPMELLKCEPFPRPPSDEQDAIVCFLDHANSRIERAIRAKRKLIALLNEQKQIIIDHAVTHGLDRNVQLKSSGVPWLGDIPKHWEVVRSRRLFAVRKEFARIDDVQLSATQAYGVIPQSEFEEKVGRRVVKISMHLEKRRHVERNDFVISMRSFQGGLERAWASGAIRSSYIILTPEDCVDVSFFSYLFKSQAYIRALQATADFIRDGQDLTYLNFRRVDLPAFSLDEQRAIATFITKATTGINASISQLSRELDLLREFRTRLTADVVTGKIDVRKAAWELPTTQEEIPLALDDEGIEEEADA